MPISPCHTDVGANCVRPPTPPAKFGILSAACGRTQFAPTAPHVCWLHCRDIQKLGTPIYPCHTDVGANCVRPPNPPAKFGILSAACGRLLIAPTVLYACRLQCRDIQKLGMPISPCHTDVGANCVRPPTPPAKFGILSAACGRTQFAPTAPHVCWLHCRDIQKLGTPIYPCHTDVGANCVRPPNPPAKFGILSAACGRLLIAPTVLYACRLQCRDIQKLGMPIYATPANKPVTRSPPPWGTLLHECGRHRER